MSILYYADSLVPKINALKHLKFQSEGHRKAFYAAAGTDIRWCSKMFAPSASEAALSLCAGKIDLFALGWDDQPKAEMLIGGSGRVKGMLHHEHKIPIGDILKAMIASHGTWIEIRDLLKSMEIVWILKSENSKLPRSNRPDHSKAYEDCGIKIIKSPYGADWYNCNWRV